MRRFLLLLLVGISTLTHASLNNDLFMSLSSIKTFNASFTQKVTDSQNKTIASTSGTIVFDSKAPAFLMHTQSPDESVIMYKQDGIYFYDAFLNQLTISPVEAFLNSPFALVLIKDKSELDAYTIEFKDNSYTLTPKKKIADIKSFSISFKNNTVEQIKALMNSGDTSIYNFSNIKDSVDSSAFDYTIPKDAEIADDR